jgi:hypothetical protein
MPSSFKRVWIQWFVQQLLTIGTTNHSVPRRVTSKAKHGEKGHSFLGILSMYQMRKKVAWMKLMMLTSWWADRRVRSVCRASRIFLSTYLRDRLSAVKTTEQEQLSPHRWKTEQVSLTSSSRPCASPKVQNQMLLFQSAPTPHTDPSSWSLQQLTHSKLISFSFYLMSWRRINTLLRNWWSWTNKCIQVLLPTSLMSAHAYLKSQD